MDRERRDVGSPPCLSRRGFLLWGGGATVSVLALSALPGCVLKRELPARYALVAQYPRKRVASLDDLETGVSIHFKYPSEDPVNSASFLVKLGVLAGGGIGPDDDIVAFNGLCPHMGGPLSGLYKHEFKAVGPCPLHLTSFDLTKHGMVIAGHATESLPQVVLELEGGEIYATGVLGLIYGTFDSKQGIGG